MSWDDYEAFCQIARYGGITAAAEHADRPKSSISAALSRLETSLNVRLVERTTRRIRLTEAGEELYSNTEALFERLHQARAQAQSSSVQISGTLRIAAPYEFSARHLSAIACQLMLEHPALDIRVDVEHPNASPMDERYDIVFAMLDGQMPSSSIVVRDVLHFERALFAAPSLLQQYGTPTSLKALAALPVVASSVDTDWELRSARQTRHTMTIQHPRLRSSNASLRLQAAVQGIGVARITAAFCNQAVAAGTLQRILPDYSCTPTRVCALLPSRRLMPAKVRALLDAFDGYRFDNQDRMANMGVMAATQQAV